LVVDSACGYLMQKGLVDMLIVGADRIAGNGDTANKIGTYMKAVCAKENHIPFYIAAPISTFDYSIHSGDDIIIEERDSKEVLYLNDKIIVAEGTKASNYAFDITPNYLINGFITENGIIKIDNTN
jgi:eIF-2B alpha/beta/delta-like uncharacterized protein